MINKAVKNETDEWPELALADPATRETVAVMLEADCMAQVIRAWLTARLDRSHDS
jgi:hypothetical protein